MLTFPFFDLSPQETFCRKVTNYALDNTKAAGTLSTSESRLGTSAAGDALPPQIRLTLMWERWMIERE
jgi:hypothetical protein